MAIKIVHVFVVISTVCVEVTGIIYCRLFCFVLIDRTFPQSHVPVPGPPAAANNTIPDFPVLPDVPNLPNIPTNSIGRSSVTGDDVDFDDLTRRFQELKKRQ